MTNKNSLTKPEKKGDILKRSEIMSIIGSALNSGEIEEEKYMSITPFAKQYGLHMLTAQDRLTEGKAWQDIFTQYDVQFFLNKEGAVRGFVLKSKSKGLNEVQIIKNRLDLFEREVKRMAQRIEDVLKAVRKSKVQEK